MKLFGNSRHAARVEHKHAAGAPAGEAAVNNKYRWIITLKAKKRQMIIDALENVAYSKELLKKLKNNTSMSINFIGR